MMLSDNGANVNMKDNLNYTALIYAASLSEDLVLELLELGADPNVKILEHSETALHISARNGRKIEVASLLKYGAHTRIRDFNKHTAIEVALHKKQNEIFQMIIHQT